MKIAWGPLISNSHSGVDGAGQSNVVEGEQDLYVCMFMIIIDEIFIITIIIIIVIIIGNRMYVICILINQVSQVFITFLPLYVGGPMWLDTWSYRSFRIWYQYLSIHMNIQLKPPLGRYMHIMCSRGRGAIAKLEKKTRK